MTTCLRVGGGFAILSWDVEMHNTTTSTTQHRNCSQEEILKILIKAYQAVHHQARYHILQNSVGLLWKEIIV